MDIQEGNYLALSFTEYWTSMGAKKGPRCQTPTLTMSLVSASSTCHLFHLVWLNASPVCLVVSLLTCQYL